MLACMGENEILETIGQLIQEGRKQQDLSRSALAKLSDIDRKTLQTMEEGTRQPYGHKLRRVELALGWRPGAIDGLRARLENNMPVNLKMATAESDELADYPGAIRAAHLTDEELAAELTYRLISRTRQAEQSAAE